MRRRTLWLVGAVFVALAVVIAWRLLSHRDPSAQPVRTSPPVVGVPLLPGPPEPSPSAPPSSGRDDEGGRPATGHETARPRDRRTAAAWKAAAGTAAQFVAFYARPAPGTSTRAWWHRVAPLLTEQARSDYQDTDPSTVPYTRVTGSPRVLPPQSGDDLVLLVQVPTNAGQYIVHLLPDGSDLGSGWHVSRLTPPATAP